MSRVALSRESYDKLIDAFAQQLWFLRERWAGIKALRNVNQRHFSVWAKYHRFFDSVYRSFVYDFYIGICRLVVDDTKGVESMLKLLKKSAANKPEVTDKKQNDRLILEEIQLVGQIKNNPTLNKIKDQRDYLLAHRNSNLLFDEGLADQFHKQNNPSSNEIDILMNSTLDSILTKMACRASFCPLTCPDTSIRREIEEVFSIIDKELSATNP